MQDKHISTQPKSRQYGKATWIDVQNPSIEAFADLANKYGLHPMHLNESVQKVQHNQVEREDAYLFLVLHFPIYDRQDDKILFGQVGIFLGKDYLITIRSAESSAVSDLFNRPDIASSGAKESFKQQPSYLLYELISKLLDNISLLTDSVVSELDSIEDLVFDNNVSDAQRIGKVRQKIVRLRRIIGPKKILLQDLTEQIDSFAGSGMDKYYSNNTKTVNRLWEVIEEAKETVEIFKDADFTTSTEQTNKILAVLTIIFTLTIPVTVVGAVYGMNVPLPGGLETGAWAFLGRYTTLAVLLAASFLLALTMYVYFRRKKWF